MKIISNFKDSYDYLQGTYGIDPKAVYERICSTEEIQNGKRSWVKSGIYKPNHITDKGRELAYGETYENNLYEYILAICGTLYCVYYHKGIFYHGEAVEVLREKKLGEHQTFYGASHNKYLHLHPTDLNEKENCPVILVDTNSYDRKLYANVLNPKLTDFSIAAIIPAEQLWIKITNFLLREIKIDDKRTDKQKIVGKGFDHKTSFRNM